MRAECTGGDPRAAGTGLGPMTSALSTGVSTPGSAAPARVFYALLSARKCPLFTHDQSGSSRNFRPFWGPPG